MSEIDTLNRQLEEMSSEMDMLISKNAELESNLEKKCDHINDLEDYVRDLENSIKECWKVIK